MREIATWIPGTIEELEKRSGKYIKQLKYLLGDSEFVNQIWQIRDKFGIPALGVKRFMRVTEINKDKEKRNMEKFKNLERISYYDYDLRKRGYQIGKSRKAAFQEKITDLLHYSNLPERFRMPLTTFVIYNRWLLYSANDYPCLIKVFEDKGKKRIFIEIYGDTKKKHIRDSWKTVRKVRKEYKVKNYPMCKEKSYYKIKICSPEGVKVIWIEVYADTERKHVEKIDIGKLIEKYKIKGGQLFRCKNFYAMEFVDTDKSFFDANANPINDVKIEELRDLDYDRKNLYKWRQKKYVKKYSSK
ncbi:MAG: hypothetical protein U9Q24_00440 [Candidatus Ratteibacteria bacterium]|nr:hypothetical protein [Candidatus Ratteibacteria bacterium]